MNCERVDNDGLTGRYLAGHLAEGDSVAFEEHVLTCDRCFEELELARVVRAGFRVMELVHESPRGSASLFPRNPILIAGLGLAAALAGLIFLGRPDLEVRQDLTRQMTIGPGDLPSYVPVTLRDSSNDQSLFLAGMDAYAKGEYDRAAEDLEAAVESDSTLLVRRLYLGASLSAIGRFDSAIPHLRAAVREPALSSDARWLLAKSLLRAGEVESGLRELKSLSDTQSTRSEAATDLLIRLADLQPPD